MFSSNQGSVLVGSVGGVPLRFHWTLLLGLAIFGGFRWNPGAWAGYLLIVILHELGHAWFVKRYRLPVVGIDVHGFGGLCRYAGRPTAWQRSVIAWGGVLAQLWLALAAIALRWGIGSHAPGWADQLFRVLIGLNFMLIVLNLLPIGHFDGAQAWKLPRMAWQRRRKRRKKKRAAKRRRESDVVRDESVPQVIRIERGRDGKVRIEYDSDALH